MIDGKNSGYLVQTKSGKNGRTFHNKELINGKVPVYLATDVKEINGISIPLGYSEKAILYDPLTLKTIGFID